MDQTWDYSELIINQSIHDGLYAFNLIGSITCLADSSKSQKNINTNFNEFYTAPNLQRFDKLYSINTAKNMPFY